MAFIAPLSGLRYNTEKIESLEDVVTPPYDVIDAKKQAFFLARNPYNMIQLDIRKDPGRGDAGDQRYERARALFEKWQEEGILIRDAAPAFYLYYINYQLPSGKRLIRKGFISLVRLAEFSEGIVRPHEEVFATVTADRLRLMDACKAQFSQIFSLYSDEKGEAMAALESARDKEPVSTVTDADGVVHTLWPITDPGVIKQVHLLLKDKPLYIADGHHRYNTALNYRRLLRERTGAVPENSPNNFAMMYLCPMEDPGLSVLPTHRLVRLPVDALADAGMDAIAARLEPFFMIEEIKGGIRESLMGEVLARMEENDQQTSVFGLYHAGEDRCFLLTLNPSVNLDQTVIDRPAALRDLDVVVLSDLIIEKILGLSDERLEQENLISYYSDPDEALDEAVKWSVEETSSTPLLFLMNHTLVSQVKRVADEKLIMPHKSTFFYPKILTGLLMNKLVDTEEVGV